jgi:SAM-dependent methyltransferase
MSEPKADVLLLTDTLEGYDRWSAGYDREPNPMVAATAWALQRRPLEVTAARVVELGCGTGRLVEQVLAGGARSYVGIDGSEGMLRVARERHRDPRCAWVHATLDAVPPLLPADMALVVLVIEHVRDLRPFCSSIARLLRPGGVLRLLDLHPDRVAEGTVAHFWDGERQREVCFSSISHPVSSLRDALVAAGFAIERFEELSAEGPLLQHVPGLAKHRPEPVLIDVSARTRGG